MANPPKNETVAGQHAAIGIPGAESTDSAQAIYPNPHPGAQWFPEAGLGLFIHWGISSVHGRADLSWGMMAETPWDAGHEGKNKITPREYFALAEKFNPTAYDPDKWLAAAKKMGAHYAVLTTRHHDGYAMWPSEYGDFGVKQHLDGRDLVGEYVEACRANGLKVGLYYSPPDWYRQRHSMSFRYGSGKDPEREHWGLDHTPAELEPKPEGWDEEEGRYIKRQIEELLTRYGQIDVLWFDGSQSAAREIVTIEWIRSLQPQVLVTPRLHGTGDFETVECRFPKERPEGWWENCECWNPGGWGYHSSGHYKPAEWVAERYAKCRDWGGNLLINVAPGPTGELPSECYERFEELRVLLNH